MKNVCVKLYISLFQHNHHSIQVSILSSICLMVVDEGADDARAAPLVLSES